MALINVTPSHFFDMLNYSIKRYQNMPKKYQFNFENVRQCQIQEPHL